MRYLQRAKPDEQAIRRLTDAGYPGILAQILSMRGVLDEAAAQKFLAPALDQLHDPFLMANMQAAVAEIKQAIEQKKRIVIFGDYDVDGVTATACMLSYLREQGAQAGYYLPNRHGEGYGLNEAAVRSLARTYDMMITVDCGITAIEEVRIAKECGLNVIVTDHHEPIAQLPECICINPKLGYPFPGLCGAGVAGKIIQAMGGVPALMSVLDLVAMGTIADIVPLLDENRVLAAEGLRLINAQMRPGIAALAEVAGLTGKEISAGHISFALAPRINAGGRMGHSGRSVDMLLAKDRKLTLEIARELDANNRDRQAQEQEIFAQANEQAMGKDLREALCLVVAGDGWNPGVIGIVASRLVEKYARPVFLLAKEGDFYVGSGRSVPGVSLFEALDALGHLFERYGGHEMAAGLTIRKENVAAFERGLQQQMEKYPAECFLPTALYDVRAELSDLTPQLVELLQKLAPTGQSNASPLFLLEDAKASGARSMGAQGAHLRFTLSQGGGSMAATAFKMGDRIALATGSVDALVSPEIDDYTGSGAVRLLVRAFSPAQTVFSQKIEEEQDALCRQWLSTLNIGASPKPGFRRYITLRDEEHLHTMLTGLLTQSPGGVLILCALPETALQIDRWLREGELSSLVTRSTGEVAPDASAPHRLLCPAVNDADFLGDYRQIILADGVWLPDWIDRLLQSAPGAAVYAPSVSAASKQSLLARVPDADRVRALYRAMRARATLLDGARSFDELHSMLCAQEPATQVELEITLRYLHDMDLISYTTRPFSFALTRDVQGRRDIEKTPTNEFIRALQGG